MYYHPLGAILNERGIVETDDHDDDAWSHAGQQSVAALAEVEATYETAAAKDMKTAVKSITANMKVINQSPDIDNPVILTHSFTLGWVSYLLT